MANFQVPQFIEEKTSIIGPLTLEQFIYLAIAGGISFISLNLLSFSLWLLVTIIAGGVAAVFAFVKVNGQKVIDLLRAAIDFFRKPRKYVWKRDIKTTELDISALEKIEAVRQEMGMQEKMKSAAVSANTGEEKLVEEKKKKDSKDKYQVVRYLTGEKKLAKKVDYL